MKKIDIILFLLAVFAVALILLIITAIQNPNFFSLLSSLGLFSNNPQGIKNALFLVLALGLFSGVVIFILFLKIMVNMFKK